jgi:hypothetical protein
LEFSEPFATDTEKGLSLNAIVCTTPRSVFFFNVHPFSSHDLLLVCLWLPSSPTLLVQSPPPMSTLSPSHYLSRSLSPSCSHLLTHRAARLSGPLRHTLKLFWTSQARNSQRQHLSMRSSEESIRNTAWRGTSESLSPSRSPCRYCFSASFILLSGLCPCLSFLFHILFHSCMILTRPAMLSLAPI